MIFLNIFVFLPHSSVRDCVVSEFGPWSPCPLPGDDNDPCDKDGDGEEEEEGGDDNAAWTQRSRVILHQPNSGGRRCPKLTQRRPCKCQREERIGEELGGKKAKAEQKNKNKNRLRSKTCGETMILESK